MNHNLKHLNILLLTFNIFMFGLTLQKNHTFALLSDSEVSTGNVLSASSSFLADQGDLQNMVRELEGAVQTTLSGDTNTGLYELMVTEFKDEFSEEEFTQVVTSGDVHVTEVNIPQPVTVFGNDGGWGEAFVEVENEDGSVSTFQTVFKREDREWKIFGTKLVTP